MHVQVMPEAVSHLCQYTGLIMVSCLLLLPWCMAITGYWINNNNNNIQQLPTAGYRQTSRSLPGVSLPTRVKTTINTIMYYKRDNSSVLTLYLPLYIRAMAKFDIQIYMNTYTCTYVTINYLHCAVNDVI